MGERTDHIRILYDLVFQAPFHCGTGIRAGLIDRTIVEDSQGFLYVPATTFKGVVRDHCERLALLYTGGDTLDRRLISPHDQEAALSDLSGSLTMITRIFGSPFYPGTLSFDDARQDKEEKKRFESQDGKPRYLANQKDVYTQVRLDRPTRTAVEGALYTSEFGTRGLTFHGDITGSLTCFAIDEQDASKPTYSLLLLLAGLRFVERLGGNKSTGKGKCECKITRVEVNGSQQAWEAWLSDLSALAYYTLAAGGRQA